MAGKQVNDIPHSTNIMLLKRYVLFLLVVSSAHGACAITTGSPLPAVTIRYHPNTPYSQTIQTSGCANPVFSLAAGVLPIGASLNSFTGVISGSFGTCQTCNGGVSGATLAGIYDFDIRVADANGASSRAYSLTLTLGLPTVVISPDHRLVRVDYGNGTTRQLYRSSFPPETFTPPGHIYYADDAKGNDSNPCSQALPCQTITQALTKVFEGGDAVYVNPGNYTERVVVTKSGTPGNPVIVSTAPGHTWEATISLPDSALLGNTVTTTVHINDNTTDLIFNGFIVVGELGRAGSAPNDGGRVGTALFIRDQGTNRIALTNNIVFNGLSNGIKGGVPSGGLYTADGNISFNNGTSTLNHGIYAYADNWMITRNYLFDNVGFGIHSYSPTSPHPQNQTVSANVSLYNGLSGIVVSGQNNTIQYNIAAQNGLHGFTCFQVNCINNIVTDNIFAFNASASLTEDPATIGSNNYDYNLYWTSQPRLGAHSTLGAHDQVINPNFVSNTGRDFRLTSGTLVRCNACYLEPIAASCDINSDGVVDIFDVRLAINQVIGSSACTAYPDDTCDVAKVQRVINASLGGPCQ
jgi:hypothetical protein